MSAILAIERASFPGDAYPASLFRLYAADPHAQFLVAIASRTVVGYIIIRQDRWGAEIVSLAVLPSWRRRGIGRTLLMTAIRRARRSTSISIRLMVHVDNTAATQFYYRHGFRRAGRVPDYYEDGAAGVRMRLPLCPNRIN